MYLGDKGVMRERERGGLKKIRNDEIPVTLGKRDVTWTNAKGQVKSK